LRDAAEYIGASTTADEVLWLRILLREVGYNLQPSSLWTDNQAVQNILVNPIVDNKTKYLAIHYHHVREKIERGELEVHWLGTSQNVADLFTTALVPAGHEALRDQLCLYWTAAPFCTDLFLLL
jgi:hypothetical protein